MAVVRTQHYDSSPSTNASAATLCLDGPKQVVGLPVCATPTREGIAARSAFAMAEGGEQSQESAVSVAVRRRVRTHLARPRAPVVPRGLPRLGRVDQSMNEPYEGAGNRCWRAELSPAERSELPDGDGTNPLREWSRGALQLPFASAGPKCHVGVAELADALD